MAGKAAWFLSLFGFEEFTGSLPAFRKTQDNFVHYPDTGALVSKANNRFFRSGLFSCRSLGQLRKEAEPFFRSNGVFEFDHLVTGKLENAQS